MAKKRFETKNYSVNYWMSHPDAGNDDNASGDDFGSLAEADAFFAKEPSLVMGGTAIAFIEMDGPGVYKVRKNPGHVKVAVKDDDWRNESRMHAAMAFGVDGWNDWS